MSTTSGELMIEAQNEMLNYRENCLKFGEINEEKNDVGEKSMDEKANQ